MGHGTHRFSRVPGEAPASIRGIGKNGDAESRPIQRHEDGIAYWMQRKRLAIRKAWSLGAPHRLSR